MVVYLTIDRQGESSIFVDKGLRSGICDALSKKFQPVIIWVLRTDTDNAQTLMRKDCN